MMGKPDGNIFVNSTTIPVFSKMKTIQTKYETGSHKTKTKSTEILHGFCVFFQCMNGFYHLVPSPVGDTKLYHRLGMGLGDKNPSDTLKTRKNHQVFLATLSWFCENRSHMMIATNVTP